MLFYLLKEHNSKSPILYFIWFLNWAPSFFFNWYHSRFGYREFLCWNSFLFCGATSWFNFSYYYFIFVVERDLILRRRDFENFDSITLEIIWNLLNLLLKMKKYDSKVTSSKFLCFIYQDSGSQSFIHCILIRKIKDGAESIAGIHSHLKKFSDNPAKFRLIYCHKVLLGI